MASRKPYFNDINVYNLNAIERYASGFPLDQKGNPKIRSLDGRTDGTRESQENLEKLTVVDRNCFAQSA